MKRIMNHFIRRGQTGQTIVILAFGFIVLLGFVGIVTDVSLLFVRYSTLRRAVDSAAVAAAGQMRRYVPTQEDINTANASGGTLTADGIAYARNVATVNLAARQFIEFYGLSPTNVIVETCLSTDYKDVELCTSDQRKLVRVTAQVASPTVFLRLLGWGTVPLEATAISETAVLDVVLIMDVSESMLDNTSHEDWETVGLGARIVPPRFDDGLALWQAADPANTEVVTYYRQMLGLKMYEMLDDPTLRGQPNAFRAFVMDGSTPREVSLSDPSVPRKVCQVRYWPNAWSIPDGKGRFDPDDNLLEEYRKFLGSYPAGFNNFVLGYNFYGCCNDPNGDGDFSDLVCQPFKQARDASLNFISQIDFARGDRVAIVTFDRGATLMLPERPPGTNVSAMIDNETNARDVLTKSVGVRAEESFYRDVDQDGLWDAFVINDGAVLEDIKNEGNNIYENYWDVTPVGWLTEVPTKQNCPFTMASASVIKSLWSALESTHMRNPYALAKILTPNYLAPPWDTVLPPNSNLANYSYERHASCGGTNMGAALRTANNALANPATKRENGAVWVMVMLSDGAAGASDQANMFSLAEQRKNLAPAIPYLVEPASPQRGDYGVYGVCPYGKPDDPPNLRTELVADKAQNFPYCGDLVPESRHFCFDPVALDQFGFSINLENSGCDEEYYDVDDYARDWADHVGLLKPRPYQGDTDDTRSDALLPTIFTIGFNLTFDPTTSVCKEGSIYDGGTNGNDYANCLGEELLRYIADVGDNAQVDTDYQQDWRDNGRPDMSVAEWGVRGPCEDIIPGYANPADVKAAGVDAGIIIQPRKPGESCGNYFNATNGLELQQVFDEIAARMFTRLAR